MGVVNDIKKAIDQAQEEYDSLLEKLKEYEQVKLKLSQLEMFINTGKLLLGIDEKSTAKEETPTFPAMLFNEDAQPATHLTRVKKILTDAGRELSLSELVEEYRKRQWKLSDVNGREVLRGVMIRHQGTFKRSLKGNVAYYELAK